MEIIKEQLDYGESKEYAIDFLKLLKKFSGNDNLYFIPPKIDTTMLKSSAYTQYITFKALICELFHNAVNAVPHDIIEYTIECKNNKVKSKIIIGIFSDLDDDGEVSVAKIMSNDQTFILNKEQVHNLYIGNKTKMHNTEMVDNALYLLYMGGREPSIKTSYVISNFRKHRYKD